MVEDRVIVTRRSRAAPPTKRRPTTRNPKKAEGTRGVGDVAWTEVVQEERKKKPVPDHILDELRVADGTARGQAGASARACIGSSHPSRVSEHR